MKRKAIGRTLAAAALLTGTAFAADPAQVQDPPGHVDVRQPADVALEERNTERDTTDTLRGGRTEVIEAPRETSSAGGVQWREVEPGAEARASFERSESADATAGAAEPMPGTTYSNDTWIGTDLGYGVGTEPVETPRR